jgi:hypothetical protein
VGPLARAALAALGVLAVLGAVALHGRAAAQAPAIVGDWVPAERTIPEPLPLKGVRRERAAPVPCAAPGPCGVVEACAASGMPALLDTRGAVEISQQTDQVRFRYAEWDTTRTVYTNPRSRPPAQDPSPLGVSFGRWERDTLAIFTTYISHPYFDRAGTAQSAAVSVLERYTPSADGTRLEWNVTVTDAATFTAPVVIVGAMARAAPAVSVSAGDAVDDADGKGGTGGKGGTDVTDVTDASDDTSRALEAVGAAAPLVGSDCVR